MRLTADLILTSPSYLNPLGDRELSLRGNKIPVIENLGATQDGFDTLDLSDNEIQKLENFPLLKRLRTLFLHNNHMSSIAPKLGESLPKLESLLLTNNRIETLADLDPLAELASSLRFLSLVNNPVTKLSNYRLYVLHLLPHLKVLDFQKVKASEKRQARGMYKRGDAKPAAQHATFVPGEAGVASKPAATVEAIKAAIQNAKTMEEVQRLERSLSKGKLPKQGTNEGEDRMETSEGESTAQQS